jgi:hypothetical protein
MALQLYTRKALLFLASSRYSQFTQITLINMKRIFLIILTLGLFTTAKSQHCSWENDYLIILDVRDSITNEIIYDLEIILTDSIGIPYTHKFNLEAYKETSIYQNTDTLKFGQNTHKAKSMVDDLPFCINRYMLLVNWLTYPRILENKSDKIFISDRNGRYESISIPFGNNKMANMCTSSPIRREKEVQDMVTIKIRLVKKE